MNTSVLDVGSIWLASTGRWRLCVAYFFYNIADVMFTVVRETDLRLHVSKARYDKGQNKHGGGIK